MAEENSIKINPTKPTEYEFDVMIQGIDVTLVPLVRFVIIGDVCDESYRCSRVADEKSKWVVKLPVLTHIKAESTKFRVEVIVDDYYFEPAQGEITFVSASDVHFKDKPSKKPSVTTKIVDEPKKAEEPKAAKVKESAEKTVDEAMNGGGGAEITGRYAPNNSLLTPEEDPTENGRMKGDSSVNDEFTDPNRLDPEIVELNKINDIADDHPLGDGKQYPQEDGKDGFDARDIASKIIKDSMGNLKAPAKKGSLFKRGEDGKPIIAGFESVQTKQEQARKAAKVKEILGTN
jgi:hypothetical protein